MSFFGFDATLPRDRDGANASKGFFNTGNDPFASHKNGLSANDGEIIDFEDTYDGLGEQLKEAGDAFNDDTFGGGTSVGRDFDFAGQTAGVRPALQQEQAQQYARHPAPAAYAQMSQPVRKPMAKTGYESYKQPDYIPQLEANASIWGLPPKAAAQQAPAVPSSAPAPAPQRKMMSLEEVEAAMRDQASQHHQQHNAPLKQPGLSENMPASVPTVPISQHDPLQAYQQQHQHHQYLGPPMPQLRDHQQQPYQVHQIQDGSRQLGLQQQQQHHQQHAEPLQHQRMPSAAAGHARNISVNGQAMTHPQQMAHLSEDDRRKFIEDEAKRAKRNHKMFLLSKHNGLMTPQDKNFITRIQLQQLVTASGGLEEKGSESQLAEDFYYQVHVQIRGAPRQHPNQPLGHFAQTYLMQTGGRWGNGTGGRRHHARGGDNHVQRMEQQVQRAVEAAKARPKNKQLTVEGSLGKIAFSNSKTPRPLLNFKRLEQEARINQTKRSKLSGADKKAALRSIEQAYATLMQMEDHERRIPPPPTEESNPGAIQQHIEWRQRAQELNALLWDHLKVQEPVEPSSSVSHPFIAILSHDKGKKLIPRVFRILDDQQRITILTLIMIHMSNLDVVRQAYPNPDEPRLSPIVREAVETFSQAVMPPLFAVVNDAPLSIVSGMLGLLLDRVNLQYTSRTKIGISMLTMLISRIELIKQTANNNVPEDEWARWGQLYGKLFDVIEPVLPHVFSTESVAASEDVHVWQFLAAMGVGASPEQQQRLVLGVKDRVMDTVGIAKTLPADMSTRKLGEVNLFMRAIGLDVELLG